jgi:hypothetical protein
MRLSRLRCPVYAVSVLRKLGEAYIFCVGRARKMLVRTLHQRQPALVSLLPTPLFQMTERAER